MEKSRRTITGPGAGDFLSSGSGEDQPGASPSKGTGTLRDENELTSARNLVPRLGPDDESEPGERDRTLGPKKEDRLSGSQTGTIGGGGPEARKTGQ